MTSFPMQQPLAICDIDSNNMVSITSSSLPKKFEDTFQAFREAYLTDPQAVPPFSEFPPPPETVHAPPIDEFKDKWTKKRREYAETLYIPKTHVIKHGDTLVATKPVSTDNPTNSWVPALHTKSGTRVFTGVFASEEPFLRSLESDFYIGVRDYTVNGITFSVDCTKY